MTAAMALSRSAPLCTAFSVRRYSVRSRVSPATCPGLSDGSEWIFRSYDISRARSMLSSARRFQNADTSRPLRGEREERRVRG